MTASVPVRTSPAINERTAAFWAGGARGELLIARCQACGRWLHPPLPICPRCHSQDIAPEATSGLGSVWSFTTNRYPWSPGLQPPYIIAEVELAEQSGLRLLTSIVDCEQVTIGLTVRVRFERAGDTWAPVFTP